MGGSLKGLHKSHKRSAGFIFTSSESIPQAQLRFPREVIPGPRFSGSLHTLHHISWVWLFFFSTAWITVWNSLVHSFGSRWSLVSYPSPQADCPQKSRVCHSTEVSPVFYNSVSMKWALDKYLWKSRGPNSGIQQTYKCTCSQLRVTENEVRRVNLISSFLKGTKRSSDPQSSK